MDRVRQDVDKEYARITGSKRACGLHEVILPHLQYLAANEPRIAYPADNAKSKDQFVQPGPEKSYQRDGQEQSRKGEKYIEHITGKQAIDPAAIVTGKGAE